MNEQQNNTPKRKRFDPEAFGCWQGCNGEYFSPSEPKCRICGRTRVEHISADVSKPQPQRTAQNPLESVSAYKVPMLEITGPCRVVITRYYTGMPLDRDNLLGGLKILRDRIAEKILRRKSDADSDMLEWEYRQEQGRGVKVQIFKKIKTEVTQEKNR